MSTPSNLLGVFCDIDDTLTIDGRLVPEVLTIMAEAQSAGLRVVPITGRPGAVSYTHLTLPTIYSV